MIYLDNSATTRFKPVSVLNTMYYTALNSSNSGRGGHNDSIKAAEKVYEARQTILKLLHAPESIYEVIFTSNCTEALNIAILGLKPKHTVVDSFSHNSVLRPLKLLERNGSLFTAIDNFDEIDRIESVITSNTELIAVNHVSNVSGRKVDINAISEIADRNNIPLLVDGAQSLGHEEIDMNDGKITFLAGAGHKGLHGVQGVGFLVIKRDVCLEPIKVGGTGTLSSSLEHPTDLPESLECGTLNSIGISALKSGIEWTYTNMRVIKAHNDALSALGHKLLSSVSNVVMYSTFPSPIIAFNIADYPSNEIADYLNGRGIAVRGGLHCAPLAHKALGTLEQGIVRASIGMNNTKSDIIELYKAINAF